MIENDFRSSDRVKEVNTNLVRRDGCYPSQKIYVDKGYTVRMKFCHDKWSAEIVVYYLWYHPLLWKQKTICLGLCL